MKKIISLILALSMVLTSMAAFAAPTAEQHTVQNNVYIEGKVGSYVQDAKLLLTLTKGEDVVYVGEYDTVKPDGSYAIKFKHKGDLSNAFVNVKYAGENVTSGAVEATTTTQIMEAEVYVTDSSDRNFNLDIDRTMPTHVFPKDYTYGSSESYSTKEHTYKDGYVIPAREGLKAVVNLKNKFAYEGKMEVLVAAYGENNQLLDCKKQTFEAEYAETGALQVFETVEFDVPADTVSAKAFCWSSTSNLIPYGKEANGELEKIDIFCIGDSTGHTWNRKWYPQAGWGTYIGDYFDSEYTTVTNYCTSGAWAQSILNNPKDTKHPNNNPGGKGFYGQGDWQEMMADPKFGEGDYVLVCLGINDAKAGDIDGTSPTEWFRLGYEEMVRQAFDAGVNIIFISATPYAILDAQGTRRDFDRTAKEVADKYGVLFIDNVPKLMEEFNKSPGTVTQDYYLHRDTFLKSEAEGGFGLTAEEIKTHGNENIRGTLADDGNYYYNDPEKGPVPTGGEDSTHINIKGANLICQKIVENLKESNSPLRFYVK